MSSDLAGPWAVDVADTATRLPEMRQSSKLLLLFFGGLALRLAWLPVAPYALYSDAAYYEVAARSIAGGSMEVPFLWSWIETGFLIPPTLALPIPAFAHWGPLASLIGAPFALLLGDFEYAVAIPFLLLGASIGPLTLLVARRLGFAHPFVAGILGAVCGLYGPFLSQPDNFALYAVIANAALLAVGAARGGPTRRWVFVGLLAGLAWLSRTDGLILAGAAGLVALGEPGLRAKVRASGALIAGFALLAVPWMARQIATFGSPIPSGSSGAIWIRRYNEQFTADGPFSIGHLFADGIGPVLETRVEGLLFFSWNWALALWLVPLLPLLFVSLRARWRDRALFPFLLYAVAYALWSILFAAVHMPGGNLLHGLLALGPISWALTIDGGARAIAALERRGLLRDGADRRLAKSALPIVLLIAALSPLRFTLPIWETQERIAREIGVAATERGFAETIVMSAHPVSLWRVSGISTVMLPFGSPETVARAIRSSGARLIVVDPAYLAPLSNAWKGEGRPDWLAEPVDLIVEEDGTSRTIELFEVLRPPNP